MRILVLWVVYRMVIVVTQVTEMDDSSYTHNAKAYMYRHFIIFL